MSSRQMSVAGSFYPQSCSELKKYIKIFTEAIESKQPKMSAKALISPHAGYIYSGFSANAAYSLIETSKINRVIVIGPSHRVYLKGASVALYDEYSSVCSSLKIDTKYSNLLVDSYEFLSFNPQAHMEHSTETQIPFVEHYFNDVSVVEIVYGDIDYLELVPIIEESLAQEESFVIISSDLSHFYTLDKANRIDEICLQGVENIDISRLESGCEACGIIGIKALLKASENQNLKSKIIDYRTSYDASKDATRVVGYMSALLG